MKTPNIFVALVLLSTLGQPAMGATELFVSPGGNDAHDGQTVATAFATLTRARDAVRHLKAGGGLPTGGVTVEILGGKYSLTAPLELTAADSGTVDAPVTYRAYQGQTVELLGGRVLQRTEFSPVTDEKIRARLDPSAREHIVCASITQLGLQHAGPFPPVFSDNGGIFELFWNGHRLPLSRWPNEGWTTMKRAIVNGDAKHAGTFEYRDERPSRWLANDNIWLKGQWRVAWEDPAIRVAQIEPPTHTITFAAGIPAGIGNKYTRPAGNGQEPWCAINLPEEIDQPGEWAIDFAAGKLYLWPPADNGELMVSQLDTPLIEGDGVAHTRFIGLTLETSLGDGISLNHADTDLIAGCTFRNLAKRGVVLNGVQSGVQSCDMYGLGWGCIYVSGGVASTLTPSGNFVLNNHLHDYGVLKAMYTPAVDVGFGGAPNAAGAVDAVGIRVAHNLIHDAPRDAVLVAGQNNVFEYNEIYHCGFGSGDVGAFYSWMDWTIRVKIRYNFIHDTVGGVNPDDGAAGDEVYGNVFVGPRTGVWIASGPDHHVANNIFVKEEGPVYGVDDRGIARGYATNSRLHRVVLAMHPNQAPWAEQYPELADSLAHHPELPQRNSFERNLIVLKTGEAVSLKMSAANRKAPGLITQQNNYVTAHDPGFVDPAAGNFALRPDAEAYQRIPGFQPIPFAQIGLQADEYRSTLPAEATQGRRHAGQAPDQSGSKNFGT